MLLKNKINIKKLKKNDPLIIKKRTIGIRIIELNILFYNSFFIIFFQNYVLFF